MPNPENLRPAKKGEVRNPKGKPKGTRNRSTIAREWLEVSQFITNPITGEKEKLEQQDIMTLGIIKKARDGDVNAYKALMDSAYGQPLQQIQQEVSKIDEIEIVIREADDF
tara:strand:+ start:1110 stop:1442 length:333 start_codon:yes stop_codon:yes gene_type:complete